MNKKKFLSELEKKLNILDEQELNDTITEYQDIIEEKVKDGKTEEEAVSEFGSIDELATEVLKAYKINPKKVNKKEEETFEGFIKDSSKKLADASKNMYESITQSNNELSLELIFEIIIKFILLLIGLAILKFPFDIIEGLGHNILNFNLTPIDQILKAIWSILSGIGYLVTCAVVFIVVFKPYFKNEKCETKKNTKKETQKDTIEERDKKKSKSKKIDDKDTPILDFFKFIFKLFMIIFVMVPIIFADFGIISALTVIIYYFFTGVRFMGLIILIVGVLTGFLWLTDMCKQITFGIKKVTIIPVAIAIVLTIFGSLLLASEILRIEYIDSEPKTEFTNKIYKKEFIIDENNLKYYYYNGIKYVEDNSIIDNKIVIEANYKRQLEEITDIVLSNEEGINHIYITTNNIENINNVRNMYYLFINNLKDNKVYNYSKVVNPSITIKANKQTIEKIK